MRLLLFLFLSVFTIDSFAQTSLPDTAFASTLNEKIVLDGKLDEAIWTQAKTISNFTQSEPDLGKPATERTQVAFTYSSSALYIAVWCYQKPETRISAKSLQRDFDYESEDNFRIVINPYNEGRTGYEFVVNPFGARTDILISSSMDASSDWNGVWDAASTITKEGWFAEIEIPFNTLKFKNCKKQIWSINLERNIKNKNEIDRWQGWSRDFSLENFTTSGKLNGLENLSYSKKFEFKPYLLGGWNLKDDKVSYTGTGKIGADLNYNISPTLKLNITANTDFAQVESDVIQVNLSRFDLYYPEKREFFLEGAGNFSYYIGGNNYAFYSRKIGIENFQSVNVLGGIRLFGKIGQSEIGFLSLQTASKDTIPTVNNTVFRYKYDLGSQSYIGGIVTSKLSNGHQNVVVGLDGNYSTSHFLKDKNLIIGALINGSSNDGKMKDNSLSWRVYCDYPNDLIDHFIGISSSQKNFSPELGFLSRTNYEAFTWNLDITPRWFSKLGVRKMVFKPWEFTVYRTQTTHKLESYFNESRPLGFILQSGDAFEFNLQQSYDRIDQPFDLTNTISVDSGKYHMHATEIQFNSYRGRRIFAELLYKQGTFYGGDIRKMAFLIGVNISRHLNLTEQFEYFQIEINSISDNIQQLVSTVTYAFTTKLDISLLGQYNSEDDQLLTNFRVHWIPRIGSDFYFVWNNGYDPIKQADYLKPTINNGAAKIVWRFTF